MKSSSSFRLRVLAALCLLAASTATPAAQLLALTTEFAPFQTLRDGQPEGFAVEVVRELARRQGDTVGFRFQPWVCSYQQALRTPDALLFSLARTPEREKQFGWVGELVRNDVALWRLAERADVRPTDLASLGSYRIGVVDNDFKTSFLVKQELKIGETLQVAPSDITNLHKLIGGRVELIAVTNSDALRQNARLAGYAPERFARALPLPALTVPLYLAFTPGSDPNRVQAYARTMQALQQEGVIDRLRRRYDIQSASR